MKVLITGATGFLGKAIVNEFLRHKDEVFTTSRSETRDFDSDRHFKIDITDHKNFDSLEILANVDVVIHAAGLAHQFEQSDREAFWRINVKGTENVVRQAVKLNVKHFVLISSVAVYGNENLKKQKIQSTDESKICNPRGDYAESKYGAEHAAREICRKSGIKLTIMRPATIIGEGDRGNFARLIRIIDKNRFLWIGKGENLKTLIYKNDAAAACCLVAANPCKVTGYSARIYNVTAESLPMLEIVDEIMRALGKTIPKFSIPPNLVLDGLNAVNKITGLNKIGRLSETITKWISVENFSGEKIRNELGFKPKINIAEAIKREVDYYKSTV